MTLPANSLRRKAAAGIVWVVLVSGIVAATAATALYMVSFERSARERAATLNDFYRERLVLVQRAWLEHLMRERARIEFLRVLDDPRTRDQRLRAYLTSHSVSPMFSGVALSSADGRELFAHGQRLSIRWPTLDEIGDRGHGGIFLRADNGGLHLAISQATWLGAEDGMGGFHVLIPLDNAFLRANAFPDTQLFIEWRGHVIAGSEGAKSLGDARPGFSGRVVRDGQRHEQIRQPFADRPDAPSLLVQTQIRAPFSISEMLALGGLIFLVLAMLLGYAMKGWLQRLLPRIEYLGEATRCYAGGGGPAIDAALDKAAGGEADELTEVATSMRGLMAVLTIRERERQSALNQLAESEKRFRDVAESAGEFIWEIDAKQRFIYVSAPVQAVFGLPADELIGRSVYDFIASEEHADYRRRIDTLGRAGEPFRRFALRIVRPDGKRRWVSFSGTPVLDADGRRSGSYRGTAEDVTRKRKAEERLLLAEKVFANSDQAIIITDAQARILSVNPAFTTITGYTAAEAKGRNPSVFASGRHDAGFYATLWRELKRRGSWAGEIWDRRKNGQIYPKWLSINAVHDAESRAITHYVGIFSDISERKENEERIAHLAYHDPLTGLPNRFALLARLEQSLADARRNDYSVAVMFIDLDHFKTINDSLGHHIGDQLLVEVAQRLKSSLRQADTVARLGGDEFVIVLPGIVGPEDAARIAEKVIVRVGEPLALSGHSLHTSPSIGIGIFPNDGQDVETVMKNADTAMYFAKQHGRNNYHFFTGDMNAAATERLLLETQLRVALDRGEMSLVYQPQINLLTGEVVGVEALLRWRHPDQGVISPIRFIPIAEDTGLIIPLGAWVLDEACRQARLWLDRGLPPMRIAVNLSAHQFRDRRLAERVREILDRTGVPADRLELEITESAVMDNPEEAVDTLRALGAQGIHLAIDDFGTGYSSLAYLKRLPIHRLKVDRSFVMDLENDANDIAIAEGIVALARSLGLAVIAEGIETAAQLEILKNLGCVEGQGYLFSRPLDAAALSDFLRPQASRVSAAPPPDPARRLH